jgi:ABC-type amino acid transport substrate-binding protein
MGSNLEMVRLNHLAACFGDKTAVRYKLATSSGEYPVRVVDLPFFPATTTYVGISRQMPIDRMDRLQAAYDRLAKAGKFREIFERWVSGAGVTPQ